MEQKKSYIISYDLIGPERDYESLISKIKSYGTWAKALESVWLIRSTKSSSEIRDDLKSVIDSNDKLLIIENSGGWATRNISKSVTEWIRNNF